MYPPRQTIRSQLRVRPRVLAFGIFALAVLLMNPVFGDSGQAEAVRYNIVYDDISNYVNQIPGVDPAVDVPSDGNGNNGHGNNQDGVDSSNPGQGHGGPNGGQDDSCSGSGSCIDDEV